MAVTGYDKVGSECKPMMEARTPLNSWGSWVISALIARVVERYIYNAISELCTRGLDIWV